MIELIFVIVILGILAAVAIPKLAATRDDAKVSRELANLSTCINDAGASYTATGIMNASTASCNALVCFTPTDAGGGNLTIANATSSEVYCSDAQTKAASKELVTTHSFGGSKVSW